MESSYSLNLYLLDNQVELFTYFYQLIELLFLKYQVFLNVNIYINYFKCVCVCFEYVHDGVTGGCVSPNAGARNQTLALWKNSMCSKLLSHVSSPCTKSFEQFSIESPGCFLLLLSFFPSAFVFVFEADSQSAAHASLEITMAAQAGHNTQLVTRFFCCCCRWCCCYFVL